MGRKGGREGGMEGRVHRRGKKYSVPQLHDHESVDTCTCTCTCTCTVQWLSLHFLITEMMTYQI